MNKNKELHDEIVKLAYEFYEKRGRIHGCDLEDWLKAERIVMERHAAEIAREAARARAMKIVEPSRPAKTAKPAKRTRKPSSASRKT